MVVVFGLNNGVVEVDPHSHSEKLRVVIITENSSVKVVVEPPVVKVYIVVEGVE